MIYEQEPKMDKGIKGCRCIKELSESSSIGGGAG